VGDLLVRVGIRAIPVGLAFVVAGFVLRSLGTLAAPVDAGLSDPGISVFGTIHPEIYRLRTPLGAGLPAGSVRVASLDPQVGTDTVADAPGCGNASYEYDGPASFDKRFASDDQCAASFDQRFQSGVAKLANGMRSLSSRDGKNVARLTDQPAGARASHAASNAHVRPGQTSKQSAALPEDDGRTAIYDISARMVYLPGGRKLEAHSGLGEMMDNPRHADVRMHGVTPPNVYNLTLREAPFHGLRAIRLNPVDSNRMHGRAGILAHPFMMGGNGQSNGCVSLRDYQTFLDAFDDGKITRLVVVERLDGPPGKLAAGTLPGKVRNMLAAMAPDRSRQVAAVAH
jgi:Tlde1 domain